MNLVGLTLVACLALEAGVEVPVVNGAFEAAKDGKPAEWRIASDCYRAVPGVGRGGSAALVWESAAPCGKGQSFVQDLSGWETGKTYRLSAWVKTEGFRPDGHHGVKLSLNWREAVTPYFEKYVPGNR